MTASMFQMLQWHERIEAERQLPGARPFISDHVGRHPFADDYLGELAEPSREPLGEATRHPTADEDAALRARISSLHRRYDGVDYGPARVIPGGAPTAFISTFCVWLLLAGLTRVRYVPPVDPTFAYLFRRFGIEPVPVCRRHAVAPGVRLDLPDESTVLVLTDPVGYMGRRVPERVMAEIGAWQRATGSLVFVDGTFQYMRWDGGRAERSAALPVERTLRLVCPARYLSLPGYRSAYLLGPEEYRDELAELHENLHGDATLADRRFAHRAVDLMLGEGNGALIEHARHNHRRLAASGALAAQSPIETGYFLFARPAVPPEGFLALDQRHFELEDHPGFVRIDLLNSQGIDAMVAATA
ncbi:hypothetical protein ACFO4E_28165 [Nocardiopsis mangrovi]|uniref:Aminotransferase class I/classII domain-containing protein n=1 Tax=Nocardiopsis mangrovi TaxID=1179818 RepID=A0ABV9E3R5_9ACTN